LYSHIGENEVFTCPGEHEPSCLVHANANGHTYGSSYLQGSYPNLLLSYGYNYSLYRHKAPSWRFVAELATFADMIERPYFYSDGQALHLGTFGISRGHSDRVFRAAPRHSYSVNISFADGHTASVGALQIQRTMARCW